MSVEALNPRPETPSQARARLRQAARLAVVQALYQMELTGRGATAVAHEFRDVRFGAAHESAAYLEADEDFFEAVLTGCAARQAEVDRGIAQRLSAGWKLERLDATARALLRAGAYELLDRADVPASAVVASYVDLASAFFDAKDVAFVNAALDGLAQDWRAEERAASGP
ncbi:MAG: transcription antitermination factor NusB [Maricaulaceae bacterium]